MGIRGAQSGEWSFFLIIFQYYFNTPIEKLEKAKLKWVGGDNLFKMFHSSGTVKHKV